jgi:competence protein ComEC
MATPPPIPIWKTAPFVRLLPPFIIGILLQWHLRCSLSHILLALACFAVATALFRALPQYARYRLQWLNGICICLLLMATGALLTHQKDIRHHAQWFGHSYHDSDYLVVRINGPLSEKPKSYKAEAVVENIVSQDSSWAVTGNVLLYFAKDSALPNIGYGDRLLLRKPLQRIRNMGNPGSFDYERYAAFQQVFHNGFLRPGDYLPWGRPSPNPLWQWLYKTKEQVLAILKKHIKGRDELGIAEALLIGHKEDLDKDLVQAYSNTGVVHIIAISGLHLGLIYALLLWLLGKIPYIKNKKAPKALAIIAGLWLFALITGASASVLRSAVMFSFIVLGGQLGKKTTVYNALAVSAALLLTYDPFLLWDVGFQLSYLAVLGIVAFQRPIYNWWPVRNKWTDKIWQLTAVSLAAQLLTFPVCLYYFHQFPILFLLANLVAVPLSSLILIAELLLVALAWVPGLGGWVGKCTELLLGVMNGFIRWLNQLPFALWDAIPASLASTCLLYAAVLGLCYWLLTKAKPLLYLALGGTAAFAMVLVHAQWQSYGQCKMVVYHVPQRQAIDFVQGNRYHFVGDTALQQPGLLQNFHLKPSRIQLYANTPAERLPALQITGRQFVLGNKNIVLIDSGLVFVPPPQKIRADVVVLSGNPPVRIPQLAAVFDCPLYVFDGTNSLWKINNWKKDCEGLALRHHSVAEKGAFVLDAE